MSTITSSAGGFDEWRGRLQSLSVQEKLDIMELIWADISQQPQNIPSPAWHEEVLRERQKEVTEGRAEFRDWEVVKQELRQRFDNR